MLQYRNVYATLFLTMSDAKERDRIHRLCKSLEVDIEEICEVKPSITQAKLELQ
jgi:energy-converting hydrogenase A subunit M